MDKPKCFGKYPKASDPGRKCRVCFAAQDCKAVKPKTARPPKVEQDKVDV